MVNLDEMSHSYPFLWISRAFNVDYGQVLKLVDMFDAGYLTPPDKPIKFIDVLWKTCHVHWRWKFPPEGRGL